MSRNREDFDSPWKDAIEEFFQEFMEFFFPAAHAQINWDREVSFLEQELRKVMPDSEVPKRLVDKLIQVGCRDGGNQWVYVHVEVQSDRRTGFAERMFSYNYRIFDRFSRPVASLAVLADEQRNWRPQKFEYELLGSRMRLDFPTVKLMDYIDQVESLSREENAFAIVTAAHLLTQQTRSDEEGRYRAKWRLVRLLYEHGWSRERIVKLFGILNWLMSLPSALQTKLRENLTAYEEEKNMPYVTSVERIAREEGIQEGLQEEAVRMLRRQLTHRFGELPEEVENRLSAASTEQLEQWAEKLLDADCLEEVFADRQHDADDN